MARIENISRQIFLWGPLWSLDPNFYERLLQLRRSLLNWTRSVTISTNLLGIWGHKTVWYLSVDCRNKITRFVCVCGTMIVNAMIEKGVSQFFRYLGLRDHLVRSGAVLVNLRY